MSVKMFLTFVNKTVMILSNLVALVYCMEVPLFVWAMMVFRRDSGKHLCCRSESG